jgi:hypothetical protein
VCVQRQLLFPIHFSSRRERLEEAFALQPQAARIERGDSHQFPSLPRPAPARAELRWDRKFRDASSWCGKEVLLDRDWFYGVLDDAPIPELRRGPKPKNPEEGKKPRS